MGRAHGVWRTLRGVETGVGADSSADLQLAFRLADVAESIALERFRAHDLTVTTKPDKTPVTDADRAIEEAIRSILRDERPNDGIYGEEFGAEGTSERQWVIDPIDGTANFLRGVPVWGTLIALVVEGRATVGVVSAPAMGRRWWGSRDAGAWVRDESGDVTRIAVSNVAELGDASVSFNSIAQWDDAGRVDDLLRLSRCVWRERAYGDMWSYMLLAEGHIDVVCEFGIHPYDVAAVIPIVEEAGGRFTAADGGPGPFTDGSALATNGVLHPAMLQFLAAHPE